MCSGSSPSLAAAIHGHLGVLKLLVGVGADPGLPNDNGPACRKHSVGFVREFAQWRSSVSFFRSGMILRHRSNALLRSRARGPLERGEILGRARGRDAPASEGEGNACKLVWHEGNNAETSSNFILLRLARTRAVVLLTWMASSATGPDSRTVEGNGKLYP